MAAKQVLLTDEGLHNLEQELEFLKTERRKEIAEKIKVALSFGDLSENSEYDEVILGGSFTAFSRRLRTKVDKKMTRSRKRSRRRFLLYYTPQQPLSVQSQSQTPQL